MDFHVRSTALIFYPQTQTDKEIKRYEATKFLESLKNPVFKEKTRTVEDYKITVILFIEIKKRTEIPKDFSNDTSKFIKNSPNFSKPKMALVVTAITGTSIMPIATDGKAPYLPATTMMIFTSLRDHPL